MTFKQQFPEPLRTGAAEGGSCRSRLFRTACHQMTCGLRSRTTKLRFPAVYMCRDHRVYCTCTTHRA